MTDVTVDPSYDEWLNDFSEDVHSRIEESVRRDLRWEGTEPPPPEALELLSDNRQDISKFEREVEIEKSLLNRWKPMLASVPYVFHDDRHRKAIIQLLENARLALDQTRVDGEFVKGGTLPLVDQDEDQIREFAESFLKLIIYTYCALDTPKMFAIHGLEGPIGVGSFIDYGASIFEPNNTKVTVEEKELRVDSILLRSPSGDHEWASENWYEAIVDPDHRQELAQHLAKQLDRVIVEVFVRRLHEETQTPIDRLNLPSFGTPPEERFDEIVDTIADWRDRIGRRAKRDPDNNKTWVAITGSQNDIRWDDRPWEEVDCVDNVYLFDNPKFNRPMMVVGMQGKSNVLTGNFLSFYHLLQFVKADGSGQSVRSRYGVELVRPDMYALLTM